MDRSWLGWAEIEPVDDVHAGSLVSPRLTYHVGRLGIDDGCSIRKARRARGRELPRDLRFSFVDEEPRPSVNLYWVRVVQSDKTMA